MGTYADAVTSGLSMGTSLFLLLGAAANEDRRDDLARASLATFLVGGVGFAVSGIVGGIKVKRCRRAHKQWNSLRATTPPGYPPPSHPPALPR